MDIIADLITRIRNGQMARLATVKTNCSKLGLGVLDVLKVEGFIENYVAEGEGVKKYVLVTLKYSNGKPVIKEITKVSKPGRRVYSPIKELQSFYSGLGTVILSTPRGVLSDQSAKEQNVGGEVLCNVF
jgi:small subunit ribosomal protein S8